MIERFKMMIFILPAVIVGLSFHEFAHATVAYLFGDSSQKYSGRLSVNPLRHIDPVGFIMIVLLGFGWAKPVVYNPNNIRRKRLARVLIALAGPAVNLIFGIAFAILVGNLFQNYDFMLKAQEKSIEHLVFNLVLYLSLINFGLGIFNLIPIAPLDGSHLVSELFRLSPEQELKYYRYGMPILLFLIFSDTLLGIDLLPIIKVINYLFKYFSGLWIL